MNFNTHYSPRTDFHKSDWKKRGRGEEGSEDDIFTREPHAIFMTSLKSVGEGLVGVLVTLQT